MTDSRRDHLTLPIDESASSRLAAGLRMGLVDSDDPAAFGNWLRAEVRGFHDPAPSDDEIARARALAAERRTTGVWDPDAAEPGVPVATVASWPVDLSVPGDRTLTAWAISSVTVSPTHRRKGIARAMLEGELAAASALRIPVAILTVSEATIYGRYGFAPAAMTATWTLDARRTTWAGPAASGTVSFISSEAFRSDAPGIHDRARVGSPAEIVRWAGKWDDELQLATPEKARALRLVRYDDADGVAQGYLVYRVQTSDSSPHIRTIEVDDLVPVTDDAYAALWRFLLEQDLIDTIVAPLRRVDEPVVWQVSDRRAIVKSQERDHLWTRILDVPAALEARRYAADGHLVIDVSDDLGYANGRFALDVSGGTVTVTGSADPADVVMTVNELSALYLGGVSGVELMRAGRVAQGSEHGVEVLDAMFRTPAAPWLSIWF